ncbi:uncharacterized protein MELLADRAFT_94530 [Melampsora larici-populina 98AG31]|uniref:Uncharacterized protein n=1 Tax=Melampsora larici-populina (strain 98AG31 / pathotype 3-4-7) TaxID=747676 RepID=F4RBR4_MELLP|nr:uncharacterized protein MELLADRAFT_94530 [Melampsora larici-populina 98AG31]EGG10149.1 hypothetical protein MELLADRAFT_94530 [Melampsora larici-populina 98AG31]
MLIDLSSIHAEAHNEISSNQRRPPLDAPLQWGFNFMSNAKQDGYGFSSGFQEFWRSS